MWRVEPAASVVVYISIMFVISGGFGNWCACQESFGVHVFSVACRRLIFFSYVNKYDGPFVAVVVCLYHYSCVGMRMHQDVAHFGV